MKTRNFVLLLGMIAALAGTAVAHDGYGYYGRRPVHYGYVNGYRLGQQAGGEDAARRIRFRATDHGSFRSGMDGYRGGNRHIYRDQFRAGYMQGYRQAYSATMARYRHGRPYRW